MLSHTGDTYTIVAGDLGYAWAGRGWSFERKRWETVAGIAMAPSTTWPSMSFHLRGIDCRATHAGGGIISGIRILLMMPLDPLHPDQLCLVLKDGYQSSSHLVGWEGKMPVSVGIQWRIHLGGLIATDIVSMSVLYE